jgi:competence ComEA-like helix-hairpin-helix protein
LPPKGIEEYTYNAYYPGAMRWRVLAWMVPLLAYLCALPALAKKKPPASPVNLNTATSEQLQEVPGIGPSTADKILQMRKSYGPFKSLDDLLAVRGIGPKRLEKMRKYLVAGKAPASKVSPANAGRTGSRAATSTAAGGSGKKIVLRSCHAKISARSKAASPPRAGDKSADVKSRDAPPAPDAKAAPDPKPAEPKVDEDEAPAAA